jgi:predicted transcriptional regulator
MEELYFKSHVDSGLKELDEGKGIPHEEVENRMSKWLK